MACTGRGHIIPSRPLTTMTSCHILPHHMALDLATSSVWAPHPCLMALLSLPQLTIGIARCCSQVAQTAARCPRHSVPTAACRLAHRARCQRRSAVALVAIGWCSRRIACYNHTTASINHTASLTKLACNKHECAYDVNVYVHTDASCIHCA